MVGNLMEASTRVGSLEEERGATSQRLRDISALGVASESSTRSGLVERTLDDQSRTAMLEEHLNLVYHVARTISRAVTETVEFEELVSAGTVGLMNALEKFDESLGYAFSTFAVPRIRGAILDELRRQDPLPRTVRKKIRDIDTAREALMGTLNRAPTDHETAHELGIETETLWQWRAEAQRADPLSLDGPVADHDAGSVLRAEFVADVDADDPEDGMLRLSEAELLQREIALLDEQERSVLALYYYEGLKLREIGQVLDLTESRISQIRTKALKTLHERLLPSWEVGG